MSDGDRSLATRDARAGYGAIPHLRSRAVSGDVLLHTFAAAVLDDRPPLKERRKRTRAFVRLCALEGI